MYLILVEIGLLYFSQGVFQVAEHEFLDLVAVRGPHFLDLYTDKDLMDIAGENSAMSWTRSGSELPFETLGENPLSHRGRSSALVCQ